MITGNFSRRRIEDFPFVLPGRTWLISIADFLNPPAKVKVGVFEEVLFLHFDDVIHCCPERMKGKQLLDLVAFIRRARDERVNLVVNCEAGICRSGAVVEVLVSLGWTVDDGICEGRVPNEFLLRHLRNKLTD